MRSAIGSLLCVGSVFLGLLLPAARNGATSGTILLTALVSAFLGAVLLRPRHTEG